MNFKTLTLAAAVAEERQTFALDTRKMSEAIALNEALTIRPEETIPNTTHYLLIESALARMKLAKIDAHALAQDGVEVAERFVEQQQARTDGKRPGDGDTLLLTA